jgi:hypothetical protein
MTFSDEERDISGGSRADDYPSHARYHPVRRSTTHMTRRHEEEEEDDSGILVIDSDIEAEFDDGRYPMPGFDAAALTSRRRLASAALGEDDSVEYMGEKRRRISDPANNHDDLIQSVMGGGRLQFGPAHRFR